MSGAELHRLTGTVHLAVTHLDRRLFAPDRVQEGEDLAFADSKRTLEEFIARRAGEQRCPVAEPGLLPALVSALREQSEPEDTELVLREELLSIFVAGVETMGTLLTWIFFNLTGDREAYDHTCREVRETDLQALGAAGPMPPGLLPYTLAVVEESLRFHPCGLGAVPPDRSTAGGGGRPARRGRSRPGQHLRHPPLARPVGGARGVPARTVPLRPSARGAVLPLRGGPPSVLRAAVLPLGSPTGHRRDLRPRTVGADRGPRGHPAATRHRARARPRPPRGVRPHGRPAAYPLETVHRGGAA